MVLSLKYYGQMSAVSLLASSPLSHARAVKSMTEKSQEQSDPTGRSLVKRHQESVLAATPRALLPQREPARGQVCSISNLPRPREIKTAYKLLASNLSIQVSDKKQHFHQLCHLLTTITPFLNRRNERCCILVEVNGFIPVTAEFRHLFV